MRPSLWLVGALVGSFPLVWLSTHGFGFAVAPSLQIVLNGYEQLTTLLFGWLGTLIEQQPAVLGFDLHLYPQWMHVFALMALFFVADIRHAALAMRPASALLLAIWGGAIAVVASVGAGSFPGDGHDGFAHATMLAFPVFGTAFYQAGWCLLEAIGARESGDTVSSRFWTLFVSEVVPIAVAGAIVVFACANAGSISVLSTLPQPGFALLVVSIVALALFHSWRGIVFAARDQAAGKSWWRRFNDTGSALLASVMLGTISGAAIFLFVNEWLGRPA